MRITETKLGNYTIKIIPQTIMPTNADQERAIWFKIETYQKRFLRPSKLIQSTKYNISPAITIRRFLTTLTSL